MKKKELGKGIRALLHDMDDEGAVPTLDTMRELSDVVANISIQEIEPNPSQPRSRFDDNQLAELAQSITTYGIIQPLTLRKIGRDRYQIIAGERRYRAAKLAGLDEVPAFIRLANDQELFEMALVENIQREDLNAIEIAVSYKRLMEECSLTQEELSGRVGKDRATISNYVRLLKLLPDIQNAVKNKMLSMGHARALAGIDDIALQITMFRQTIDQGWSVRQLEQHLKSHFEPKSSGSSKSKVVADPQLEMVKNDLRKHFGTKVQIDRNTKGEGAIRIYFNSNNEFNRILDILQEEI
ncbi:MAG TPA: ParB/RepB/Spo0J family partition protein [Saprospiraceae bacterium]|nr:ParB/RepB/Spo0J family partition protein [Saprospiraceae bacterium]HQW56421.1 ParB/RepB/Spo0J family partition protein [Saprospiraceae bacterium]